jgi:hypothetical protein
LILLEGERILQAIRRIRLEGERIRQDVRRIRQDGQRIRLDDATKIPGKVDLVRPLVATRGDRIAQTLVQADKQVPKYM